MEWKFTLNSTFLGSQVVDEPIGWSEIEFTLKRDTLKHGVFFTFSAALGFICDGYWYIKDVYDAEGIETDIFILVELDCDGTGFVTAFDGVLNLTSLIFDDSKGEARCNIEDNSPEMRMFRRADQKIDLFSQTSLDGSALAVKTYGAYDLTLPGKTIIKRDENEKVADFVQVEGGQLDIPLDILLGTLQLTETQWAWFGYANTILDEHPLWAFAPNETGFSQSTGTGNTFSPPTIITNPPIIFTAGQTADYLFEFSFDYDIEIFPQGGAPAPGILTASGNAGDYDTTQLRLLLEMPSGTIQLFTSGVLNSPHDPIPGNNRFTLAGTITHSNTYSLLIGDDVRLYWEVITNGLYDRQFATNTGMRFQVTYEISNVSNFLIELKDVAPPSEMKAFLVYEAFSRIIESYTDNAMVALSDYFGRVGGIASQPRPAPNGSNGCASFTAIGNGFMVRQFPNTFDDPTDKDTKGFYLSLNELFNAMSAIYCIGMGIEPDPLDPNDRIVRIEPIRYFYHPTSVALLITDFDTDKLTKTEFKRRVDLTDYYSELETGYSKWTVEDFSGLDEFNTPRQYRTKLTKHKQTLSRVCDFIAGNFAIEITRREDFVTFGTKDNQYDSETFVFRVDPADVTEFRQGVDLPANLLDPATVGNWEISPYTMARRWYNQVGVGFYSFIPISLFFTAGEANVLATGQSPINCTHTVHGINESEPFSFHVENEDLSGSGGGFSPFELPEIVEFTYPLSLSEWNTVKADPKGLVQIDFASGGTEYFWIREIVYLPNDGLARFKLVAQRP